MDMFVHSLSKNYFHTGCAIRAVGFSLNQRLTPQVGEVQITASCYLSV
jgi:hypothetical protein